MQLAVERVMRPHEVPDRKRGQRRRPLQSIDQRTRTADRRNRRTRVRLQRRRRGASRSAVRGLQGSSRGGLQEKKAVRGAGRAERSSLHSPCCVHRRGVKLWRCLSSGTVERLKITVMCTISAFQETLLGNPVRPPLLGGPLSTRLFNPA